MAQAQGFTCDYKPCSTFKAVEADQERPTGWIKIVLPRTDMQTAIIDAVRDLCSERCGEKFLKDRRVALSGSVTSHSTIDDALRDFLAANGVTGQAIGGVVAGHVRFHGDSIKDECLLCQYNELAD